MAMHGRLEPAMNGCSLHPDCLTCPLPRCRFDYDRADSRAMQVSEKRLRLATALVQQGKRFDEILCAVGVSARQLHRYGVRRTG